MLMKVQAPCVGSAAVSHVQEVSMILLRTGTVLSLRDRDEMDANTSRSYHLGAANIFALHVMAIASIRTSDRIERAV